MFIAEPVGSCTDLKATVDYPLRRLYGDDYQVAPLSVMIDPLRALRILGMERARAFSSKVAYIYGKQLEEADILVINKIDLLSPSGLQTLREALAERFPKASIVAVSARQDIGLDDWLDEIIGGPAQPPARWTSIINSMPTARRCWAGSTAACGCRAAEELDGNCAGRRVGPRNPKPAWSGRRSRSRT